MSNEFSLCLVLGLVYKHGNDGLGHQIIQILADHVEVGCDQVLDDHNFHLRAWGPVPKVLLICWIRHSQRCWDIWQLDWLDVALDVLVYLVILVIAELRILQLLQSAMGFTLFTFNLNLVDILSLGSTKPTGEHARFRLAPFICAFLGLDLVMIQRGIKDLLKLKVFASSILTL